MAMGRSSIKVDDTALPPGYARTLSMEPLPI
jgi:hypothetical protein